MINILARYRQFFSFARLKPQLISKLMALVIATSASAYATATSTENTNSTWELARDKAGVKVWTRSVEGSNIKAFKGETELDVELNQAMALMDNTENYTEWMHQCKSPTLIRKVSPIERYTYMINDLPWPAKNRDVLAHVKISQNEQDRVVTVVMRDVKEVSEALIKRLPNRKGLQALDKMEGHYRFIPISDTQTKVIYEMHIELGGSLPATAVNAAIVDTPYYTLKNMRSEVTKPQYQHFKPF